MFPEDFGGLDYTTTELYKDIALLTADLQYLNGIDKAKKEIEIKELVLSFNEEFNKPVIDKIIKMNTNFEKLIFNLSEKGNETINSIEQMNVYKFFRYKQFIIEKFKPVESE